MLPELFGTNEIRLRDFHMTSENTSVILFANIIAIYFKSQPKC